MNIADRFKIALFMQEEYKSFPEFANLGMMYLGYNITWMQSDIADYMANSPKYRMVMSQRGEAKSTLSALYAIWRIIQDPKTIVLVISGGEAQASEVANLIIRLLQNWPILDYLKPDTSAGDRNSRVEFDIHNALKGLNKSPSIACVGVTSTLQGKRADLLIADDIETTKNSLSATQRQTLLRLTQEFSSINASGDILYLGTPQTKDSIYNTLENRGFEIRIWPGRFPTDQELENYGDRLAPSILKKLQEDQTLKIGGGLDGTRGKPTDPFRFNEEELQNKELDQGPEGFQLQYMLDTRLMDEIRQQLKLSDLIIANFDNNILPEVVLYQSSNDNLVQLPSTFSVFNAKMYQGVIPAGTPYKQRGETVMYIDPAGSGGDETSYGVATAINSFIHVLDVNGFIDGLSEKNLDYLASQIVELRVDRIVVESNMGHGLFEKNLLGGLRDRKLGHISVKGIYNTGQKERRIIDALVSGMKRHKIIIHPLVLQREKEINSKYSIDKRKDYSLFYQLANITTDRGSLVHDDRIEVLAGVVKLFGDIFSIDEDVIKKKQQEEEIIKWMRDPFGTGANQLRRRKGIIALITKRNSL